MVMSSFRRSVVADTKKKGKSKNSWYDRLRLPQTQPGAPILIYRGEYVDPAPAPELAEIDPTTGRAKPVITPYFKVKVHKRAIKGGAKDWFADDICSQGHDAYNPQPCVGCFAIDSGDKSVGVADNFVFTVAHLAYYHEHPYLDKEKGGIVMKNDNSGPVMIQTECIGRTCNFCRVRRDEPPLPPQAGQDPWPGFDPRTLTTVFGKRRYLELGKGHLSDIEGIDQVISSQCGNCHSQLVTSGYACPHCNTLLIEMLNDPRSDEQITQEVMKPYPCVRCNRPVLLKEIIDCETCTPRQVRPLQLSIFNVVIYGMRQGEGRDSHITQGLPHKTLEEFSRGIDPQFLGGKSLQDYLAELVKPYDFSEIMKPHSLQDQAQRLRLPMPSSAAPSAHNIQFGYAPYTPMGQVQQPAQLFSPEMQRHIAQSQVQMAQPPIQYQNPQPIQIPQAPVQYQNPQQVQQPQVGPPSFIPLPVPNFGK